MADIDLPDTLLTLERQAWQEIQAGALTINTAYAVHQAVAAHAEATGTPRLTVETALKRAVRHPEAAVEAA